LHRRLVRRGVTLSAVLAAAELSLSVSPAAVPALLTASTLKAAILVAAGKGAEIGAISTQAAALTKATLNAFLLAKVKTAVVLVLAISVIGAGVGTATQHVLAQRRGADAVRTASSQSKTTGLFKSERPQAPSEDKAVSAVQQSAAERHKDMTVTGRVLDPDGKPAPRVEVAVLSSGKAERLGLTRTDQEGRFRLRVRRASSHTDWRVSVIAAAPGYGLGWQSLHPDTEKLEAEIRLPPEQALHGRLIDLQGQGAAGVKVYLAYIALMNAKDLPETVGWREPHESAAPWPAPVTTDEQGRFTFHGIGRGMLVGLDILVDHFARQTLQRIDTSKEVTLPLEPPQLVEGRITCEDTTRPVPHARLVVQGENMERNRPTFVNGAVTSWTDAEGRFRVSSYPGNTITICVYTPEDTGYLGMRKNLPWPKGTAKQKVDLAVPRGVRVRGKVTESGSGKPVAGAQVDFVPRRAKNPYYRDDVLTALYSGIKTASDGTFQITVLPGPSHLVVQSSTPDFIQREVYYDHRTGNFLDAPPAKEPGIIRVPPDHCFVSNFAALDLKPEAEPPFMPISLRRGVTARGRLVMPDGKPVGHVKMLCRLAVASTVGYSGLYPVELADARFELPGCDPEKVYPVYFLDAENQYGAVAEIPGKPGSEPVEVRLLPCGSAVMRLVNGQGKPLSNYRPNPYGMAILVRPGFPAGPKQPRAAPAVPDRVRLTEADRRHYFDGLVTNEQGRITLPALIPGAAYRVSDGVLGGREREFTAEAGKNVELPDLVMD
jgi:protocatechuate 3,4-dioxygenase beta subunit